MSTKLTFSSEQALLCQCAWVRFIPSVALEFWHSVLLGTAVCAGKIQLLGDGLSSIRLTLLLCTVVAVFVHGL